MTDIGTGFCPGCGESWDRCPCPENPLAKKPLESRVAALEAESARAWEDYDKVMKRAARNEARLTALILRTKEEDTLTDAQIEAGFLAIADIVSTRVDVDRAKQRIAEAYKAMRDAE